MERGVFSVVNYRLVVGIQVIGIKVMLSHVIASLKEQRVDVVERPVSAGNMTVSVSLKDKCVNIRLQRLVRGIPTAPCNLLRRSGQSTQLLLGGFFVAFLD